MARKKQTHLAEVIGPEEFLRRRLMDTMEGFFEVSQHSPGFALRMINEATHCDSDYPESYCMMFLFGMVTGAISQQQLQDFKRVLQIIKNNHKSFIKNRPKDFIGPKRTNCKRWGAK